MRQEFNRPINQSHYFIWKHCLRVCCTHRVANLLYFLLSLFKVCVGVLLQFQYMLAGGWFFYNRNLILEQNIVLLLLLLLFRFYILSEFKDFDCHLLLHIPRCLVTNPICLIFIRQRKQTRPHPRDINLLMQQLYFYELYYSTTATLLLKGFPVRITHIMSLGIHRGIWQQHNGE